MTSYAEGKRLNAERAVNEQRTRLTHLRNAQARGEDVDAEIEVTASRLDAALAGARWLGMSDAERARERGLKPCPKTEPEYVAAMMRELTGAAQ